MGATALKKSIAEVTEEQTVLADDFWRKAGLYLGSDEIATVRKAYDFAYHAHAGQFRKSGHHYFFHLLSVADILCELRATHEILIAALLHDIIEDTSVELSEVIEKFGDLVGYIVQSATKLQNIEDKSIGEKRLESLRRMIALMERHPEGLLVKLADRLHNIRTLDNFTSIDKRRRIAKETLEIYAPLAERLGVEVIKTELEEICFKELFPEEHARINAYLEQRRSKYSGFRADLYEKITRCAKKAGFDNVQVYEREKRSYSVWKKMHKKHYSLEDVKDIYSLRIVLPTAQDCYDLLKLLERTFDAPTSSYKDYIASPKENGYQSLHTVLFSNDKDARVELQIRSLEMHHIAEFGVAAHWKYKNAGEQNTTYGDEVSNQKWMQSLLRLSKQNVLTGHMTETGILCLTRQGDTVALPEGATVLDFAYALNSSLGDRCVGAKVNGIWRGKETKLQHVDQVEVVTSTPQRHRAILLKLVKTEKAANRIQEMNLAHEKKKQVVAGQIMMEQYLCALSGVEDSGDLHALDLSKLSSLGINDFEDFYASFAGGKLCLNDVLSAQATQREISSAKFAKAYASFIGTDVAANKDPGKDKATSRVDISVIVKQDKPYLSILEQEVAKFGGKIIGMEIGEMRQDFIEVFCHTEFETVTSLSKLEEILRSNSSFSDVRFNKKEYA